jgi:hypothetical protein
MGIAERNKQTEVTVLLASQEQFDVCWMALCLGRVLLMNEGNGKQSHDERIRDTVLLIALKAISTEAPEGAEKIQTGDANRVWDGVSLTLTRAEILRLLALIDRIGWQTSKLEIVQQTVTLFTAF